MSSPPLIDGEPPSCGEQKLLDYFIDGFFVKGWECTMAGGDTGVLLVLTMMIYGSISFALFISTGSLAIPAVLAVLFAGVIFVALPATAVNLALVALLLLLGVGGVLLNSRIGGP